MGKLLGGGEGVGGNFGYFFSFLFQDSFLFHLLSRGYKVPKALDNCKF